MSARGAAARPAAPPFGALAGRRIQALLAVAGVAALWLAAVAVLRSGDAPPGPPAAVATDTPAAVQAAGERALALVSGASAGALGYDLRFAPASAAPAGVRAETDRNAATITVYVAAADAPHVVAHDIAHELGHASDDRLLTDAQRREYLGRRGVPDARWWPGGGFSDYATGAGDFAEVFALCHAASPEYRSRLAPRPENACALLPALPNRAAGGRMGAR